MKINRLLNELNDLSEENFEKLLPNIYISPMGFQFRTTLDNLYFRVYVPNTSGLERDQLTKEDLLKLRAALLANLVIFHIFPKLKNQKKIKDPLDKIGFYCLAEVEGGSYEKSNELGTAIPKYFDQLRNIEINELCDRYFTSLREEFLKIKD